MTVLIRPATAYDVEAVVDVGRRTWPQTYAPIAGEDYVRLGLAKWWTIAATRPLVNSGKATVAELDGQVVGVAVVGPLQGDLVLFRLYVVPEHQGQGIGRLLLEDVMDGLFHIARSDGAVTGDEMAYLARVAELFGFSPLTFRRLQATHLGQETDDPYLILKVAPDVSDAELHAAWRRAIAEAHPDRARARGLPEDFVEKIGRAHV